MYASYNSVGLQYGPAFRMLLQAWAGRNGASSAFAKLRARVTPQGTPQVHPADLDGALQLGALTYNAQATGGDGETRVPFNVDEARMQEATGVLWASISRQSDDVFAVGLDGAAAHVGARLDGFRVRVLRGGATQERNLYVTDWRAHNLDALRKPASALMVGDWPSYLSQTARVPSIKSTSSFLATAVAVQRAHNTCQGVVAIECILGLAQLQAAENPPPSVWVLTRGIQPTTGTLSPLHAGAWGLA
eukprot:2887278-Prymnesium_polylepis.1